MAKILIFANDESTIYNFRRELLAALIKDKFRVLVCCPFGEHSHEIERIGCELVDIKVERHGKNIFKEIRLAGKYLRILKKHSPDIVLTYTIKPNIYASIACQLAGIPYINNVTGLGSVFQNKGGLSKLLLLLQKIAYRKSSCVFFQNADNYKKMKECKVISDRIPVQILPGSGVNLELQAYVGFPEDDGITRFIIIARIRADKGYQEFFEAAEKLKFKYPDTEFHVVGWYEEDRLKAKVHDLMKKGIIIYHGSQVQEEVHRLIAKCNCLVHPSYHEGMANVLLEAAATGRPVIATRISGCREAFEEGISGYGCEAKDPKSLLEAMEKMVLTPYEVQERMGRVGRKKMEREFDRNIVVNVYRKQIRKTIREK